MDKTPGQVDSDELMKIYYSDGNLHARQRVAAVIAHVTPQIRSAAIEDTVLKCVKAIERLQENYSLEHGRESYGSVEYPEGGLEFLRTCDDCIDLIRTAITLAPLPPGHVCVPAEPTHEMLDAAQYVDECADPMNTFKAIWEAMIAAAKEPK